MYCPTYHITMASRHCLLYQDYARGAVKLRHTKLVTGDTRERQLAMRYRPCLDCETGRQVKANGGQDMDGDIKALKDNHVAQYEHYQCRKCGEVKTQNQFYRLSSSGKLNLTECKQCASERHKAKSAAKKQRKCQICKCNQPTNNFTMEENICDACWAGETEMTNKPEIVEENVTENMTAALSEKPVQDAISTCKKCGYAGPDIDFHKGGMHGVTNVCLKCVKIRMQTTALPDTSICVDFSDYPHIRDQIEIAAKTNFRTVTNEILFRLVNFK